MGISLPAAQVGPLDGCLGRCVITGVTVVPAIPNRPEPLSVLKTTKSAEESGPRS
jgi:hypothetical protein